MSLDQSPAHVEGAVVTPLGGAIPAGESDYWHALIDEKEAASFLGLVDRTLQTMRQRGGGARYVVISSRCIRYRRADLKTWADTRLRSSTADPGLEPQPTAA